MKIFSALTIALLIIFQTVGFAATGTFSASGEYLMSDYDTPEIAEEIALDFAKQNAAEQAGIYLENYSRSIDSEVEEDEVKTVASSKVEVLTKNITRKNQSDGRILLRADIKAKVDTAELDNFLAKKREQRQHLIQQYKELQAMNEKIKQDIDAFQAKLAAIRDDVKDEDLLVEQERINRKFLSTQKLKELDKVTSGDRINELRIIDEAIKINPRNGEAYNKRARVTYQAENFLNAIKYCNRALALDPQNADYYADRGWLYRAFAKNYPRAIEDYNQAIKLSSKDKLYSPESGLQRTYWDSKDYSAAIENFTQIIQLYPQDIWGYRIRGGFYELIKDYSHALEDYNHLIRLEPKSGYGYIKRGEVYEKLKDYSKASSDYDHAWKLEKKWFLSACQGFSSIYRALKDYSGAVEKFTEMINLCPTEEKRWAYRYRAKMYATMNDNKRALEDYNKIVELANTPYWKEVSYETRAEFYVEIEDYEHAIEDYTNIINLDQTEKHSYFLRAQLYIKMKDYTHALGDYTNIINLDPNDAEGYRKRAFFYEVTLKDYKHAIEDYTQAINLNPNVESVYVSRSNCFLKIKDYSHALEDCYQLIRVYPNNPLNWRHRGDVYTEIGSLLGKGANNDPVRLKQAVAFLEKALADYDKALELDPNNRYPEKLRQITLNWLAIFNK